MKETSPKKSDLYSGNIMGFKEKKNKNKNKNKN